MQTLKTYSKGAPFYNALFCELDALARHLATVLPGGPEVRFEEACG